MILQPATDSDVEWIADRIAADDAESEVYGGRKPAFWLRMVRVYVAQWEDRTEPYWIYTAWLDRERVGYVATREAIGRLAECAPGSVELMMAGTESGVRRRGVGDQLVRAAIATIRHDSPGRVCTAKCVAEAWRMKRTLLRVGFVEEDGDLHFTYFALRADPTPLASQ